MLSAQFQKVLQAPKKIKYQHSFIREEISEPEAGFCWVFSKTLNYLFSQFCKNKKKTTHLPTPCILGSRNLSYEQIKNVCPHDGSRMNNLICYNLIPFSSKNPSLLHSSKVLSFLNCDFGRGEQCDFIFWVHIKHMAFENLSVIGFGEILSSSAF